MEADAVTHGRQLQLTARSNFPKASFTLDGNVDLARRYAGATLNLQFANLDINPFLPAEVSSRVTRQASLEWAGATDVARSSSRSCCMAACTSSSSRSRSNTSPSRAMARSS